MTVLSRTLGYPGTRRSQVETTDLLSDFLERRSRSGPPPRPYSLWDRANEGPSSVIEYIDTTLNVGNTAPPFSRLLSRYQTAYDLGYLTGQLSAELDPEGSRKILKAGQAVQDLYYQLTTLSGPDPLGDNSLTLSANWTHEVFAHGYADVAVANGWPVQEDHPFFIVTGPFVSPGAHVSCIPPTAPYSHEYELAEATYPEYRDIGTIAGSYARGTKIHRYLHGDLRPFASAGDTHGVDLVERWTHDRFSSENPAVVGLATTTTTVTRILPQAEVLAQPQGVARTTTETDLLTERGPRAEARLDSPPLTFTIPTPITAVRPPIPGPVVIAGPPVPVTLPDGSVTPVRPGQPSPPVQPSQPAPAPTGVKERKFKVSYKGFELYFRAVLGATTETLETINALWKALPKAYRTGYYKLHYKDKVTGELKTYYKRRRRASQHERIQDVYRNFEHLDVPEALDNLLAEATVDRSIGEISRTAGRAYGGSRNPRFQGRHRTPGIQAGPWDTIDITGNLGG